MFRKALGSKRKFFANGWTQFSTIKRRSDQSFRKEPKIVEAEIEGLFREAQTRDATFARDKGIIDEIRDIQIPAGAPYSRWYSRGNALRGCATSSAFGNAKMVGSGISLPPG
jgi:hypothetical protein